MTDIYDGTPWTELDIDDLALAIDHGCSMEDAVELGIMREAAN